MKNTLLRAFLPATLFALILGGCQKNIDSASEEGLRGGTQRLASHGGNCNTDCIAADGSTKFVKSFEQEYDDDEGTVNIDVYNTPTHIVYVITSSTNIRQINFNGANLYASSTSIAEYTHSVPIGIFETDWDGCDLEPASIEVKRNNVPGSGGGVAQTINTSYNLIPVCQDCEDVTASAYPGDLLGENTGDPGNGFNNAWWYAFDIDADATQDVYAEVNDVIIVVGTATNDVSNITISLNAGWELQDGTESVKWYSYADGTLPTAGRPTPGQAPNKGSSLVIPTSSHRYYVIHLDLKGCI